MRQPLDRRLGGWHTAGEHITRRASRAAAATLRAATHIQLHHSILIFTAVTAQEVNGRD